MSYDRELRGWTALCPFALHDSKIVHRSSALLGYGKLQYREVLPCKGRLLGLLPAALLTALFSMLDLLFYWPVTRRALMKVMPAQGQGPSREVMDNGYFTVSSTTVILVRALQCASAVCSISEPCYAHVLYQLQCRSMPSFTRSCKQYCALNALLPVTYRHSLLAFTAAAAFAVHHTDQPGWAR